MLGARGKKREKHVTYFAVGEGRILSFFVYTNTVEVRNRKQGVA